MLLYHLYAAQLQRKELFLLPQGPTLATNADHSEKRVRSVAAMSADHTLRPFTYNEAKTPPSLLEWDLHV
jgi:hypothetical protein